MLRIDGRGGAVVRPRDDRASRTVADDGGTMLEIRGGAQCATVHRPRGIHCPRWEHVLGIDVGSTVSAVLPGDNGTARTVLDDPGELLDIRGGAHRATIGGPGGVHLARGHHVLSVDVVVGSVAVVPPGDDSRAGTVCGDGGVLLVVRGGAHHTAVHGPRGVHRSGGRYVLRIDVGVGALDAMVLPRNESAPHPIRDDHGVKLVIRGGAQPTAVDRPGRINCPRAQHMLGVDIGLWAAPIVVPGNDRPASSISDDGRAILVISDRAQRLTIGGPGGVHLARGQHVLGVDVVARAATVVMPGDNRPAGAAADAYRRELVIHGGAEREAIHGPSGV